jgi:hypothetical protein
MAKVILGLSAGNPGGSAEILLKEAREAREAGENIAVQFPVDEGVLRPRVAGFIDVGGSIPS